MKTESRNRKTLYALGLLALLLCLLAGCARKSGGQITSLEQLNHPDRKIGVSSDTAEDQLVMRELPLAQVEYVKDNISAYTAVSQGKLDAFVYDKMQMELAIENGQKGVRVLDAALGKGNQLAVGISPVAAVPDLKEKIDAFLDELKAGGTMDEMWRRWVVLEEDTMPEIPVPEASQIRLVIGTTGSVMPYSYYKGTQLTGLDIEMARRFAAWLGAELEFKVYSFDGIIPAAIAGDVDCIMANLFVTEERKETLPFSEPIRVIEIGVMVRDPGAGADISFLSGIRESFFKTFIRESPESLQQTEE